MSKSRVEGIEYGGEFGVRESVSIICIVLSYVLMLEMLVKGVVGFVFCLNSKFGRVFGFLSFVFVCRD